jgi:pimeloyl-ACP methyl ester carboxylesterase
VLAAVALSMRFGTHAISAAVTFLLPWRTTSLLSSPRMTISNMTCDYVRQPLNHFALPRHSSPHYYQRYCTYDEFAPVPVTAETPVLFYTGNESPLETYINHTGLIWQLAPVLQATVVFAEHRYEGKSLPPFDIPHCLAYSSSVQAIADYARLIELHYQPRPVIVFGGSYGGMLSSWMRMQYPNLVAGAIAGSAPIWGLPLTNDKIDGAAAVIDHGLRQPYPPTKTTIHSLTREDSENHCSDNMRAAWPLMQVLSETPEGREILTTAFSLCSPMQQADEVSALIGWAQSPWFDLAEGSFPYPSSYIPFALTHNSDVVLPAWPLQAACWKASRLAVDLGIDIVGDASDVRFTATYGDSNLSIAVDWGNATALHLDGVRVQDSLTIRDVLSSVRDAVGVWFNMTSDLKCYNLTAAPNRSPFKRGNNRGRRRGEGERLSIPSFMSLSRTALDQRRLSVDTKPYSNSTASCKQRIQEDGSWPALCCNEEMSLIITEARGLGGDMFWPPSHPRGTKGHADIVAYNEANNQTIDDSCKDPHGSFGFPNASGDPWSTWLDTVYGGTRIESHSNIVFSNGLLDPWSAAGVYIVNPTAPDFQSSSSSPEIGLYIQNITKTGGMIALIMEYGGHHTDLMYDDPADPPSIRYARQVEKDYIELWIQEWNSAQKR